MFESNLYMQVLTYCDSCTFRFFHFLEHIAEISQGLGTKTHSPIYGRIEKYISIWVYFQFHKFLKKEKNF